MDTVTPSSSAIIVNLDDHRPAPKDETTTLSDFYAYLPAHKYIHTPTRELWPAATVNNVVPPIPGISATGKPVLLEAAKWLDRNRACEQMTWLPGADMIVRDFFISDGGWFSHPGASVFNLYLPPSIEHGDPNGASRWINHVNRVYPNEADHIIKWLAHRVQHPSVKINHALLLGGEQGIGKDSLLVPVVHACGPWNCSEVSPKQVLGRFNGFIKSVILRISEARDLGDVDRFGFYDAMKTLTAAPPDVLRCDEKNVREHAVFNVTGVILTSNYKTDGLYLPSDDRRHFVAWSERTRTDFPEAYWTGLYGWYAAGGIENVAAYLATLDISAFDPKAPPPKTPAFWSIVDANQAPENAELADVLDQMGNPNAVTIARLALRAEGPLAVWLTDRKNSRQIPHRLEQCGLVRVRNDAAKDGQWVVGGKRQAIYAKKTLPLREQIMAARTLADR
jgi:hypothetical protein